jgi:hypothetical protein
MTEVGSGANAPSIDICRPTELTVDAGPPLPHIDGGGVPDVIYIMEDAPTVDGGPAKQ